MEPGMKDLLVVNFKHSLVGKDVQKIKRKLNEKKIVQNTPQIAQKIPSTLQKKLFEEMRRID